jgi:hypothetical protein
MFQGISGSRGFQPPNLLEMEHRSPRCVFNAEQIAKLQGCPLESEPIVIEVRLGEAASVAPMAQKRTIVHPSVACPRGCRAVRDESCLHCSNLFLNEELDKDGVGTARLPYQKIMMFSEP